MLFMYIGLTPLWSKAMFMLFKVLEMNLNYGMVVFFVFVFFFFVLLN